MMKSILMLVLAILTLAAMAATLYVFFRRIGKIEEARWGQKTDWRAEAGVLRKLLKKRKA
jgi:hypothetical protein